jgi:peroxidase
VVKAAIHFSSLGDSRTNQMISLVTLHTIFLREHNRLANELSKLNPHWTDEEVFLEARQIVVAELQVITYKEFLPIVIGELNSSKVSSKTSE